MRTCNDLITVHSAHNMLKLLLSNYFTLLKAAEIMHIFAELNNFAETVGRTVIDWIDHVETTKNKMGRLNCRNAIWNYVSERVRGGALVRNVRLNDVVTAVRDLESDNLYLSEYSSPDRLSFDELDVSAQEAHALLDHYVSEFRTSYTNMDFYKKCRLILHCGHWKSALSTQVNAVNPTLMDVADDYEMIDSSEVCNEYERELGRIYRRHADPRNLNYYDLWSELLQSDRFKRESPNLHSLVDLVWSIVYSNAEAERMVHVANAIRNKKRCNMSMILLNAFMHIKMNGPALHRSDNLIAMAVDYWTKIGGSSAVSEFTETDIINSEHMVEEYYNESSRATGTAYAERKKRRKVKYDQNDCVCR